MTTQFVLLGIVLGTVVGFHVVNRLALPERKARVVVKEKFYKPAGETVSYVGGRARVNPQREEWVFKIDINGRMRDAVVSKDAFERIKVGSTVEITFKQQRLLRTMEISRIESL